MKAKTSITLSEDLLKEVDQIIKGATSRSNFIEQAIKNFLNQKQRENREKIDFDILNQHSDKLNAEAGDVLSYQAEL
jgi:metal-responsive CopG/Arc/MetJ family transcriptional regulator